jgi:hypothetical protein
MLNNLITSKTRVRLLVKFFINVANEGYLRGLATEMQESTNAIRKELNNLTEAGYLIRTEADQKITYKANQKNPFFTLLQQIVHKYVGLDAIVASVLERIGGVKKVFLVGDYWRGMDSGTIEVVLEGVAINKEYVWQLAKKLEKELNKTVIIHITATNDTVGLLVFEQEF